MRETTEIQRKTGVELLIENVPFPAGFKPRFVAMDSSGCWHVFQAKPRYQDGDWVSLDSNSYEIGIDDSDDSRYTPAFAHGLQADATLCEISDTQ